MTCSFLHRIRQLLEFLVELTHMEAVHQGVVDLDVDGQHFSAILVKKLAEDDADIAVGGDGGGLDDLGEGDPEGKFYYTPMLWAVENGITAGLTETTFGLRHLQGPEL